VFGLTGSAIGCDKNRSISLVDEFHNKVGPTVHTATIEFYSIIFLCQSFVGKTREMKGVKRDENKRENGVPNQLE
jgi:hypothetical protein